MSPTVPPVPSLNFFAKTLDHGDETADSRRDCEKEAGEFSLKRNETKRKTTEEGMIISIPPRRDEGWRGGVASFWEKTSSPWRKSALDWNICATSGQGQPERGVLSRNTLTTGSTGVMGTRGGFSSCPVCFLVTSPLAR